MIGDNSIEQVHSYTYLGHEETLGRNNQIRDESKRISVGWVVFGRLILTEEKDV